MKSQNFVAKIAKRENVKLASLMSDLRFAAEILASSAVIIIKLTPIAGVAEW